MLPTIETNESQMPTSIAANQDVESKSLFLGDIENWTSNATAFHILDVIFKDEDLKSLIKQTVTGSKIQIQSFYGLLELLDRMFQANIASGAQLDDQMVESLYEYTQYKKNFYRSVDLFNLKSKPNPKAVYWPNPKRDSTQSIYETLPFVKNLNLVNSKTPIGSAGSCFAFEIAYNLQKRNFNYVITEKKYQPEVGVFEQSDNPSNPLHQSSANWGDII